MYMVNQVYVICWKEILLKGDEHMNRRLLVAGVTATIMLAGCGSSSAAGSSSGSKTVSITFDAMQYSAASNRYFPQFVKQFEAIHPNIHVHLRVINWSSGHQVLNTEIGGGNAPNVAIIGTRWLPSYVNSNLLVPLTSDMSPSFAKEFYPATLASIRYHHVQYSLPEAMSVRLLVYNKALFAKAGISNPPKTWAQLAYDAVRIHRMTGESGYGLVGTQVETSLDYWYTMWGFGGHTFHNNQGALTSSPDVKALQFLDNLIKSGGTEPNVTASSRASLETQFAAGKIGMMIDGPWLPKEALANHVSVGIASIPAQPGVTAKNPVITDSMVMFKNSHQKASWQFMKFMFSKSVRTTFDKTEGMIPVMRTEAQESYFQKSPVFQPYLNALNGSTRHEAVLPHFDAVSLAVTNAVEAAYSHTMSAKQALSQANAKVTAALRQ